MKHLPVVILASLSLYALTSCGDKDEQPKAFEERAGVPAPVTPDNTGKELFALQNALSELEIQYGNTRATAINGYREKLEHEHKQRKEQQARERDARVQRLAAMKQRLITLQEQTNLATAELDRQRLLANNKLTQNNTRLDNTIRTQTTALNSRHLNERRNSSSYSSSIGVRHGKERKEMQDRHEKLRQSVAAANNKINKAITDKENQTNTLVEKNRDTIARGRQAIAELEASDNNLFIPFESPTNEQIETKLIESDPEFKAIHNEYLKARRTIENQISALQH